MTTRGPAGILSRMPCDRCDLTMPHNDRKLVKPGGYFPLLVVHVRCVERGDIILPSTAGLKER